jgi:antitoxin component of MazEF toxin-antitoxin module
VLKGLEPLGKTLFYGAAVIKSIIKIGNSQGLIFDSALMDLARLKPGDQLNVEVHANGVITLTPVNPRISKERFDKELGVMLRDYSSTLKKLS